MKITFPEPPALAPPDAPDVPARLRLRLIGQMDAWSAQGESVLPPGRKTRALLALVALSAPRPALRSRLAEMLWSRRPEEQARASLRQEIHRLLESLADSAEALLVSRDQITLRPGACWVDVEAVQRATAADPAPLALLDADLLEGMEGIDPAFDAWLIAERERLRDRARGVAEALLRAQIAPEPMIAAAQNVLSIDRTHEGAWRALMAAHAAQGERGMAIQAYERCRAVLSEQLDATPSPETQRLLADIRNNRSAGWLTAPGVSGTVQLASSAATETVALLADAAFGMPMQTAAGLLAEPGLAALALPVAGSADTGVATLLGRPTQAAERVSMPRNGAWVGVLPLQVLTVGDAAATSLAQGLAEELSAGLIRCRWLSVVSSGAIATLAAQTRDEAAMRSVLGLDYLIDGTLQRLGDRVRLTLRLLDLRIGSQVVWARRFDRQSTDLLTLQDDIAAAAVAQIDPEILLVESRHAAQLGAGADQTALREGHDSNAYMLVMRAIPPLWRLDKPGFMQARSLLERALQADPEHAAGHAWLAFWHLLLIGQGWAPDRGLAAAEAGHLADRAMQLDPQDARALTIAGHVQAFLHRRPREALTLHDRALRLNPHLSMAWNLSGRAHAYLGELDEAERRINRYKQLSPIDPHAFYFDTGLVSIALLRGDFEGAVVSGREVSEMNASYVGPCKAYLAALGHLGRMQEAAEVLARLQSVLPHFNNADFERATPFLRAQDRAMFVDGMRRAGVPETAPAPANVTGLLA